MNKTQNGSGGSNLKQEHYIKPEDKVIDYLARAEQLLIDHPALEIEIEIAKMIQLEEHREDK